MTGMKLQSAMEYLMTYGWAILVIAVVLGVMYTLGVFNPINYAPKAQPGSCQVFRPNGPGSNFDLNVLGECQGEQPEYTAHFSGSNYFVFDSVPQEGASAYTISMWTYLTSSSPQSLIVEYTQTITASGCSTYGISANPITINAWNQNYGGNWYTSNSGVSIPLNSWKMITVSLSGGGTGTGTLEVYVNGTLAATLTGQEMLHTDIGNPITEIGGGSTGCTGSLTGSLAGGIANMQMYNATLNANDIAALYQEGIGGAPINLQSLVGWWPLNGNVNDYSGNNNNGVPTAVSYTGSWQLG